MCTELALVDWPTVYTVLMDGGIGCFEVISLLFFLGPSASVCLVREEAEDERKFAGQKRPASLPCAAGNTSWIDKTTRWTSPDAVCILFEKLKLLCLLKTTVTANNVIIVD